MSELSNILEQPLIIGGGFDESRVINKDYLNSLEGVYKCGICFKIMDNPTDCETCGHSFCYDCIKNLKCPFKCQNKKLKPSSQTLKDILSKLKFKCMNKNCEKILNYSDVKIHDKNCDFQEIICPDNNCDKKLLKKNLENHVLNECQYSLIENNNGININNNLDTNEYIKLLSMNVSKIVKENQDLINKNNNSNNIYDHLYNENNENEENIPNPANYAQIDEEELLNIIKGGIEGELKKYFLDFDTNLLKLRNDIKNIKEKICLNKNENTNEINEESNIKDMISKTENNIKNIVFDMNEKILEKIKLFSNKLEENIRSGLGYESTEEIIVKKIILNI